MGFAFTTGPDTRRKPGQQATAGTNGRTATWARHIPSLRSLSFFSPSVHAIAAMAAVTLLTACGAGNGRFRIEGRFRNLNRGEFYVYSPDGVSNHIHRSAPFPQGFLPGSILLLT